ncbi:MAG: sodium:proton antiporter [Acidobacteria bacterium]|nr:sodium:proton antiporter [Acidobacteriota bacterium]
MGVDRLRAGAGSAVLLVVLGGAAVASAQAPKRPVNERGPADAPITVEEFCTYDSEPCSRLHVVLETVLAEFGDRVRLVFRHVPVDDTPAASLRYRAALAAGAQGQFWPMHDLLMANRQHATAAEIPLMAHQLGLDPDRFRADIDSADVAAAAAADRDAAREHDVTTAPAVIVNGRPAAADVRGLRAAIRAAAPAR